MLFGWRRRHVVFGALVFGPGAVRGFHTPARQSRFSRGIFKNRKRANAPLCLLHHVELQRFDLLEHARAFQTCPRPWGQCADQGTGWRSRLAPRPNGQGKVGDVDAVLAHGHAQKADDARHVFVGGVKHVAADFGVDIDALDLDEARLAVTRNRCPRWTVRACRSPRSA